VFVHVRVQCPIHIMKQSKESVQLKRDRTEAGTIRYKAILTSCYTTPGCSGCRLRCPLSWPSSGCLSGGSAFVYSITRRHWDLALSRGTGPFHHPRRIRLQPRSSRDIQSDMQSDFGHHDRRRAQALIARGPRTNLFYLGRCPSVRCAQGDQFSCLIKEWEGGLTCDRVDRVDTCAYSLFDSGVSQRKTEGERKEKI
jgi:hypothetical protein